jgi:hypothetical protein
VEEISMSVSSRFLAIVLLTLAAAPARAATFDVTNTADAGVGSLRQAIVDANAGALPDRIHFAIAGDGPHVITPLSPLPALTDTTSIDGETQLGTSCDVWPPTLQVVLDGSQAGATSGLVLNGDDSTVRGLVIHSFEESGILVSSAEDVVIQCNFLGTDATGLVALGNDLNGVRLEFAQNATIGGALDAERNLISGNTWEGVAIYQDSEGSEVIGNAIGTDATGFSALPNGNGGVLVRSADVTVGGPGPLAGNLISGNFGHGVGIGAAAHGALVFSNRIGVDLLGAPVLGNSGSGVLVTNIATGARIGAPPFEDQTLGNVIAGNTGHGVSVYLEANLDNSIRWNSIFDNGGLGIALLSFESEPTPNDPGDADEGPNRFQNFPEIASADVTEDVFPLALVYSVPTDTANATYPIDVDFYLADADGQEGRTRVATDGYGLLEAGLVRMVSLPVASPVEPGDRIVATATDAAGNTSEFSPSIVVPEPGGLGSALAAFAALAMRAAVERTRMHAPV